MKNFQMNAIAQRLAIFGVMALAVLGALIPATVSAASVQSVKCAAGDTNCVITFGNALITERLSALNALNSKIASDLSTGKITPDQASALQADIATNETGLNNLKTKLDSETVTRNARIDVANIYLQFRVYAVVIPRDARHLLLDVEINARVKLLKLEPAIQAAIAGAPASKQAQLNALFSDYQKQLADAESQFDIANQDLPQMTPENFNQNRPAYQTVRLSLVSATRTASQDLHQAAKDLHQMVLILGHSI